MIKQRAYKMLTNKKSQNSEHRTQNSEHRTQNSELRTELCKMNFINFFFQFFEKTDLLKKKLNF